MAKNPLYIQNPRNRQYLGQPARWVSSIDEARPFHSAIQAYHFVIQNQIEGVEIVFQKSAKVESVLRDLASNSRLQTAQRMVPTSGLTEVSSI